MRRSVLTAGRLLSESTPSGGHWVMVTFTYAPTVEWHPKHLTGFLKNLRAWAGRRGFSARYVWTLELTARGRPHYHVLAWIPNRYRLPKADSRGWWKHGMTRTERAKFPIGYLSKYCSKGSAGERKDFPKGARISGNGGLFALRATLRYWLSPRWLREQLHGVCDVVRVVGGYVERDTGHFFRSPWRFVSASNGQIRLALVG